jgi:nucleoside-diphosphate-sugar epimerase
LALSIEKEFNKDIIPRLKFGSIEYRKDEIMIPKLDNSKLTSLGWRHKIDFKEGIAKILKEYT